MSTFRLDVKSDQAKGLQSFLQVELVKRAYSTEDDQVMAEYVVVMLANQKTQDQITSELSDLIGSDFDPSFTSWLWDEADKWINGSSSSSSAAAPMDASISAPPESQRQTRRRSRSPLASRRSRSPLASSQRADRRRSRSPPPPYSVHDGDRAVRDYDDVSMPKEEESFNGRAFWQKRAEDRRRNPPPRASRELFANAVSQATGERPHHQAREPDRPVLSIFGRAGIPDPTASEFVPAGSQPHNVQTGNAPALNSGSIFSRIDPMLPNNEPISSASSSIGEANNALPSADFPTVPAETSLCRWNLKCTNPKCTYSHASPANAGPGGDENALVLSEQACKFGATCTNKDCTRSHVSPSIAFIDRKVASAVSSTFGNTNPNGSASSIMTHGSEACRFQDKCTNPGCRYAHYDAQGNIVPSPALVALSNGDQMNEESRQFTDMQMSNNSEDNDDAIITTTSTNNQRELELSEEDKKAKLLDQALSNTPASRPCKFGVACTRHDCFFSHPPGRKTLTNANSSATVSGQNQTPCRFGLGCTRPNCYFSHPPGRNTAHLTSHTSNRLAAFSSQGEGREVDEEMERIIPGQQTQPQSEAVAAE